MANDLYSLAQALGAKNITSNSLYNSPIGASYLTQKGQLDNAEELLKSAQTPLGAIGAGINYYIQSKNNKKALEELGLELKNKSSTLASIFPEDQRAVASTLDLDTLTKLAAARLAPEDSNAQLDRQYKQAQINKINRDITTPTKPLPTPALKLQNEGLDIIGTASGINADLAALNDQIDEGKLDFGPVKNLISMAKNKTGLSDEQSRNFGSFERTLEKLRNDSLRLNKGVQTEGDAVRAWGELLRDKNDPQIVKQRLNEIQAINARAADLQKLNIDQIRANYGAEPLDYSGYQNRQSAVNLNQGNQGFKILNIRDK